MAFRRVIFTSNKLEDIKKEVERFFTLDKFKTDFPGVKTTIKPSVKSDVFIVDVNGEGADSVSRKLKDIGAKFKATVKVRNEIKTTPIKEEKIVKVKQLIKEEVRKILSEQEYEHGQFFTDEDEKSVYKELMVPYKGNLEYVFIWFRELIKRGKVKFIPEIKPFKSNTEEDRKNYTQSHTLDYVDENTGEIFTVIVLDEDWYESVRNVYPENKYSLEIMKRENLIK